MGQKSIKTAILGLNEGGQALLETAFNNHLYEIAAVADVNTELVEKISAGYECAGYDDYRQLLIQNDFDALLVAAPLYICHEHIKLAIKNKVNVLKLSPPANDFDQAVELKRMANKENVYFVAAKPGRFQGSFQRLREYIESAGVGNYHLINAVCNVTSHLDQALERWLSDPQLAGGGVLLRNSYDLIDLIVNVFGIPEKVYSLNTNHAPDKQQRLSITEDTAVVTMKFSDVLFCNLTASRVFGPQQLKIRIHSEKEYITVTEDSFQVCSNSGEIIEQQKYKTTEADLREKMLEDFALNVLDTRINLISEKDGDFNNMAVIECAYVSARTGMPEEPSRILDIVKA